MPTEILVKDLRRAFEQARELDGSMAERLDVFAGAARKLHPAAAAIVDRLVARLKQHKAGENAPKPGDPMPPFVLPDETGHLIFGGRASRRSHVSPRTLVSLLPHQHQHIGQGTVAHRSNGRAHGGHNPRTRAVCCRAA